MKKVWVTSCILAFITINGMVKKQDTIYVIIRNDKRIEVDRNKVESVLRHSPYCKKILHHSKFAWHHEKDMLNGEKKIPKNFTLANLHTVVLPQVTSKEALEILSSITSLPPAMMNNFYCKKTVHEWVSILPLLEDLEIDLKIHPFTEKKEIPLRDYIKEELKTAYASKEYQEELLKGIANVSLFENISSAFSGSFFASDIKIYFTQKNYKELKKYRPVKKFEGFPQPILSINLSSTHPSQVVVNSGSQLNLFDTKTEQILYSYHNSTSIFNDVSFSPLGNFLISSSEDGTTTLFNAKEGILLDSLRYCEPITTAAIAGNDNYFFALTRHNKVLIGSIENNQLNLLHILPHIKAATYLRNVNKPFEDISLAFITTENTINVHDALDPKPDEKSSQETLFNHQNLYCSPNGLWLYSYSPEEGPCILGPDKPNLFEDYPPTSVRSATFSPDSQWFMYGDTQGAIKTFNINNLEVYKSKILDKKLKIQTTHLDELLPVIGLCHTGKSLVGATSKNLYVLKKLPEELKGECHYNIPLTTAVAMHAPNQLSFSQLQEFAQSDKAKLIKEYFEPLYAPLRKKLFKLYLFNKNRK